MQCYTELIPPTAVTHSIAFPFTSRQIANLIVAKSSLLQVYRSKTIATELELADNTKAEKAGQNEHGVTNDDDGLEASFLGGDNFSARADRASTTKLVLMADIPLSGTITGLARIKIAQTKSGGDALLISLKDAKLSLVEWDPEKHELATISIHYYEQDDLQGSPWAAPLGHYVNFLAADPGSRCAALKFGAGNLAILPFRHDEDNEMGEWDEDVGGPRPVKESSSSAVVNGGSHVEETPYSPSFVLRLSKLDSQLLHPVHLSFLYEYREPTFGILSSTRSPSNSLGRKDHLSYTVFTLDLQQKASTTILTVGDLPQDLFRVLALPGPVGGALLVGTDELIHIDQSGRPNGVAVNPLTKQATSFSLVDQSDLNLRLEGCLVDVLAAELGELLLILNDGRMALLTFRVDGRTVSGLEVKMLPVGTDGSLLPSRISSLTRLTRTTMFAGSDVGDSLVFGWTRRQGQTNRRRCKTVETVETVETASDLDSEFASDSEDEDDLYTEVRWKQQPQTSVGSLAKAGELNFRIHDSLPSLAPIRAMTYGKHVQLAQSEEERNSAGVRAELQLTCVVGRHKATSLALINREIQPKVIGRFDFPEAKAFWTMCAKKPVPKTIQGDKLGNKLGHDYDLSGHYDKLMIVAKVDLDGYETSDVYALTAAGFETLTGSEFEPAAGFTVEAGTMGKDHRIIQVLKSEVRCYTGALGLSQILPMLDDETGVEPRVMSASIADPFLLLIRDDCSAFIAKMDKTLELEEVEREEKVILSTKWLTGCLYADASGVFADKLVEKATGTDESILMFLLSTSGALHVCSLSLGDTPRLVSMDPDREQVYRLPDLSRPIYVAEGLSFIPPFLSADYAARKGTAKETITELVVADLGDTTTKSPYLILRHANDDLTIYQPFRSSEREPSSLFNTLLFHKLPNPTFAKTRTEEAAEDDAAMQPHFLPMRSCENIAGYSTVFLPGPSPSFILKSAKSMPKVVGLQGCGVQAMSPFHTRGCEHGFIYADSHGIARVTQIPSDCSYAETGGLSVKKVPLGLDTVALAFHAPMQTYVLGCNTAEPFELPKEDDYHKEWARENITFKPETERGLLGLLSPVTWTMIDSVQMEACESVMCVETFNLEVSESTNERKQLIAVGTAICKGEDFPTRGRVYVYDIADVIPEPGRPETNQKLKLLAKEDIVRGAVTALCEVGTQGLMLVAQGQKCMVRGLKEDGTLLPVAFMDMSCYVTSVKEVPGTGLCLMADAFKGLWFAGYTEDPYRMILFGKSSTKLEVNNADFLVDGKDLAIVASDADGHIHILHFEPEHPKSLQGHLLVHRTTFSTGAHQPTSSLQLPSTVSFPDQAREANTPGPQLLLLASPTGVLATLRPLSETSYRRLSSLATQLTNSLPHPAGLNPRAYRLPAASCPQPGVDAGVGRSIVDGSILQRWAELGTPRRGEVAGRAGYSMPHEVRAELDMLLGWSGLAYF